MSETQTATSSSTSTPPRSGYFNDIIYWKRKNHSFLALLLSTLTWVLLEAYQFNFVTVASWTCMFAIATLFFLDNLLSLLGKEPASVSSWEVTEETAEAVANYIREVIEEVTKWMFRVSAEKKWYVFARTVVLLFILAKVAALFDLLSLLYIGTLVGMTVPVTYRKYEERITRYTEGLKARWRRMCEMVDDRVVRKLRSKFVPEVKKDKKVE